MFGLGLSRHAACYTSECSPNFNSHIAAVGDILKAADLMLQAQEADSDDEEFAVRELWSSGPKHTQGPAAAKDAEHQGLRQQGNRAFQSIPRWSRLSGATELSRRLTGQEQLHSTHKQYACAARRRENNWRLFSATGRKHTSNLGRSSRSSWRPA